MNSAELVDFSNALNLVPCLRRWPATPLPSTPLSYSLPEESAHGALPAVISTKSCWMYTGIRRLAQPGGHGKSRICMR